MIKNRIVKEILGKNRMGKNRIAKEILGRDRFVKEILGYLICFFHSLIVPAILIIPFVSRDRVLLLLNLVILLGGLFSRFWMRGCLISREEKKLLGFDIYSVLIKRLKIGKNGFSLFHLPNIFFFFAIVWNFYKLK